MILKLISTDCTCTALRIEDITLVQKTNDDLGLGCGLKYILRSGAENTFTSENKEDRDRNYEIIVKAMEDVYSYVTTKPQKDNNLP